MVGFKTPIGSMVALILQRFRFFSIPISSERAGFRARRCLRFFCRRASPSVLEFAEANLWLQARSDERRLPVTSASDEDKYTFDYFPHGGRDGDDEPPFKYRTFYLDDAVAEAWRIARGGGSALRITRQGESAFDEDGLRELLDKMSKLESEQSGRDERELAALALGDSGGAEPESGDAEPEPGEPDEVETEANDIDKADSETSEIESPS
jgi:hypothetical protein